MNTDEANPVKNNKSVKREKGSESTGCTPWVASLPESGQWQHGGGYSSQEPLCGILLPRPPYPELQTGEGTEVSLSHFHRDQQPF